MDFELILAMVEALGDDATFCCGNDSIEVVLIDCEGFEAREFDDEEAVLAFEETVRTFGVKTNNFFQFDGFKVFLTYESQKW